MKRILSFLTFLLVLPLSSIAGNDPVILPDLTVKYASRDTCDLYFDLYRPAPGSPTSIDGKEKPAILFLFGGGFIRGSRNSEGYLQWFKDMTDDGYCVISIDYRLGLKGCTKVGVGQVKQLDLAIHMAVEDAFSATRYIIDNAAELGVNPDNIVISGSSAGAISSLQAEYEICNRTQYASVLPDTFNYAGVMSFAGAILSMKGKLRFAEPPCPMLMLHGTEDRIVNYGQTKFLNIGFFGSDRISSRLSRFGFVHRIFRYVGHGHEIASVFVYSEPVQKAFLEENVVSGIKVMSDMLIDDPRVPAPDKNLLSLDDLYGK